MSLRTRIYLVLSILVAIALCSGGLMVWQMQRIQKVFNDIIDHHVKAYETAAMLETALVYQRGLVTYFFLDGDVTWLNRLEKYRDAFRAHLIQARNLAGDDGERATIQHIEDEYGAYLLLKDRVIELYRTGQRARGAALHAEVRRHFFKILALCQTYKRQYRDRIHKAQLESARTTARLGYTTVATIAVQMLLVIALGFIFIHHILAPVYRMLLMTTGNVLPSEKQNIIRALSARVDHLVHDMDEAQHALEKSRENLLQAEKMALVGQLAAGMAHSIRNPFTSVKMRLFSLGRSLKLTADQEEDFEVISHEIRHIDTIVQNFLEFSRPPKLMMQSVSPSTIVDNALQLLSHRLNSYGVDINVVRTEPLPEILADPEQIKEVLVNIIINACEEMKEGGTIMIEENLTAKAPGSDVQLRISDSGAGIHPTLREKIFQPFFTTKEEGTGLGLSIAARIVGEHGGALTLENADETGACLVITLPIKETGHGNRSGH